jgi:hypothetical protein
MHSAANDAGLGLHQVLGLFCSLIYKMVEPNILQYQTGDDRHVELYRL